MNNSTNRRLLPALILWLGCSTPTEPGTPNSPVSPVTARVNGQLWSATNLRGDTIGDQFTLPLTFEVGGLDSTTSQRTTLRVIIGNLTGTGTYTIAGYFAPAQGTYAILSPPGDPYINTIAYQTDSTHVGVITVVSLDTVAHFVAGTFAFQATSGSQTVRVTEGRFRGHFKKY